MEPFDFLIWSERTEQLSTSQVLPMNLHALLIEPIGALIAGLLILIIPRLLNYVVAIYLIVIGVVGLAPHFFH
jgi:hypothetical protein